MTLEQLMKLKGPVFAPDDGTGGGTGDDTTGGGTGDDTTGGGTGDDTLTGGHWSEGLGLSAEDKNWFEARGMHKGEMKDALLNAIKGQRNAEQRLGGNPDQLISKPGQGDNITEWMKANADLFGLPAEADGYNIERPDMPEGVEYDEALEKAVVATAYEQGIPPAALSPLVKTFAEHQAKVVESIDLEINEAKQAMTTELQKDWGDQTNAKMALARQGLSAVAEAAGLNSDGVAALTQAMKDITGTDATVFRFGAALAEMMGDDGMVGLGKGANDLGVTPADARQKAAQMRSKEGEYGRAVASGDRATANRLRPELQRLDKIAAQGL